ncbi:MAG: pyridoxal phosphate-dependent aminotransferase [Calditrichaeota bacterium]|nr:pyridoxal phosphate-dependent aminotransferase [Calditrichota bacterium]
MSGFASPQTLSELGLDLHDIPLKGNNYYGYLPLKEALAEQYGTSPDHIAITPGASMANYAVCSVLASQLKQIIVETPTYQPFISVAESMKGCQPQRFTRNRYEDYHLNNDRIKKLIRPESLVIISNPHNPSGVYDQTDVLLTLADNVARDNSWLMVDEVFLPFITNSLKQHAANLHERMISTSSLTKVWGLSKLRIGWVIAQPSFIKQVEVAMDYMHLVMPFIIEYLAFRVLSDETLNQRLLDNARKVASENLELVNFYLKDIPELDCIQPECGISMLIRFKDGRNSESFTNRLLTELNTAVMHGKFFEVEDGFRISFGGEKDVLKQGLEAIQSLLILR